MKLDGSQNDNSKPDNEGFHYDFDMIASVVDGFWEINLIDGHISPDEIIKSTPATNSYFELPPNLSTKEWRSYIHPEDHDRALNKLNAYLNDYSNTDFYIIEYRIRKVEGTYHWIQSKAKAFRDSTGKALKLVGMIRDISDQKRILLLKDDLEKNVEKKSQELQEKVNFQEAIFDSADFAIISVNPKGIIKNFNRGAEKMFGYSADELVDKQAVIIFHLEQELLKNAKHLSEKYNEKIEGFRLFTYLPNEHNIAYRQKWTMVRKNGEHFPTTLTFSALRNHEGEFIGLLGVVEDMSALEKTEKELKIHKERYDLIVNNSADYVWLMSWELKALYIAPSCQKFIGYTAEEIGLMHISKIHSPSAIRKIKLVLKKIVRAKDKKLLIQDELEYIHKNGNTITADVKAYAIYDEKGKPYALAGISRDITERKNAELEREKLNKKLQKAISFQTNMFDSTSFALVSSDETGLIKTFNQGAEKMFGYSADEVIEKHRPVIFHLKKEITERARKLSQKYNENIEGFKVFSYLPYEKGIVGREKWTMLRKNGEQFPALLTVSVLKGEEGEFMGLLGIVEDISELEKTEKELKFHKEKYDLIVKNSTDYIWLMTWDMKALYLSPSSYRFLGYTKEELSSMHISQIHTPTSFEKVKQVIKEGYQSKNKKFRIQDEFEYIHKNGSIIIADVKAYAVYDKSGKSVAIAGVSRDITKRKKIELEKEKLVQQLERTQALIGLGTWILDILNNKVTWSSITYDIYEFDKDKEPSFELFANSIVAKQRERILNSFQDLVNKKVFYWKQEYEMITFKGKRIYVEVMGERVTNNEEEVTKYAGTIRDITQRKKEEQERKNQSELIKEAYIDIQDSIYYAKTIQEALLTKKELIDTYFEEYFILFKPKEQVSGDFYYVNKIKNHLIFAVADCTGHGVPGGFLTMLGITYLHEIVNRVETNDVAAVLNLLRERVKDTFKSFGSENKNGLDIALCEIDTASNILQYAGAFHPLWIIRNNELLEYKATRNPVGFHPKEVPFQRIKIKLQKNDMIYLFCDGFRDQFGGPKNSKYGRKMFRKLLLTVHKLPLSEQNKELAQVLKKWKGKEQQVDDITIMGIKW